MVREVGRVLGEKKRPRTASRVLGKVKSGSGRSYCNFRADLRRREKRR